ncbi:hypothetical protein GGD66_004425 [Bradyrhizobium sp. CIR48]|uniref:hypothetical protein n=1 Tax=Bradyrhizobium sp. CIR48 TaxID=2663840 RepID=UPI00160695B2|nr:hypothetical protein [Bradyrhizobium sp. CIR48]MBB4425864.1 hypothetical protein [Bradyrhizobium sp. CIR48]
MGVGSGLLARKLTEAVHDNLKNLGGAGHRCDQGLLAGIISWRRDAVDENVGEEARFDQSRFHQRRVNEVAVAPNASADPFLRRPLRCPCPRWRILSPSSFTIIGVYCSGNNVFDVYVIAKLNAAFVAAMNDSSIKSILDAQAIRLTLMASGPDVPNRRV